MRLYKTIYQSETCIIQRIITQLGDCKMIKYREIIREDNETLEVNDMSEPPAWLLRQRKLKELGI